ncbi:MAG: stage III sporulation protein D [Ruminococcaceae bacterium]|nr:stage III sporulation protein D [Oscillospiraceae bacterium]
MSNRLSGDCSIPKFFVPYLTPADISERLPAFNRNLYLQAKEVLDINKAQRHIRGGIATRKKYRGV